MWFTRVSIGNPVMAVMVMLAFVVLGLLPVALKRWRASLGGQKLALSLPPHTRILLVWLAVWLLVFMLPSLFWEIP